MRFIPSIVASILLILCAAGCSSTSAFVPEHPPATETTPIIEGNVHGGQQAIIGASIQLYTAGAPATGGGYGLGSTALISSTTPVLTDLNGNFSITGKYTIPTGGAHLYIVATGGSPGVGLPNTKIAMMAVLEGCTPSTTLSSSMFISINEVTTMAAVTALQAFMAVPSATNTGAPAIGAPATAYANLQNAFETANNLASITTGAVVPALNNYTTTTNNGLTINTLADALASCVNSIPGSSNACSTLFTDATPSTATYTATDTIQAAQYIALNPTTNIGAIYGLASSTPPFVGLTQQPSTFATPVTTSASACQVPVPLGSAGNYAILAGTTVTNASTPSAQTTITGGLVGVSPGTAETGFTAGTYTATFDNADAGLAESALTTAYNQAAGLALPAALPMDMSNLTFTPGLYKTSNGVTLNSGSVTLDAQGDPNAAFVFQIGSTLIAATGTQVILVNGAQSANVFWQVGSSATMSNATAWVGNILAYTTITFGSSATLHGRAMASNGSVTLQSNTITIP